MYYRVITLHSVCHRASGKVHLEKWPLKWREREECVLRGHSWDLTLCFWFIGVKDDGRFWCYLPVSVIIGTKDDRSGGLCQ